MNALEPGPGSTAAIRRLQAAETGSQHAEERAEVGRAEPVEILGPGLRLAGTLSVGGFNRLSDFVNLSEGLVGLRDGRLLGWHGEDPVGVAPELWLTRRAITMIAQREPQPIQDREGFRVTRQTQRLSIVSHDLLITGNVHLPEGGSMTMYMGASDILFVPMTDVEVQAAGDPQPESVRYAFALVNRGRIDAIATATPHVVAVPVSARPVNVEVAPAGR